MSRRGNDTYLRHPEGKDTGTLGDFEHGQLEFRWRGIVGESPRGEIIAPCKRRGRFYTFIFAIGYHVTTEGCKEVFLFID